MTIKNPQTLVMGILNVTPDSFSDGGQCLHLEDAINGATRLLNQGADIIDIGGESTRPGAASVSEADEISRVVPVIKALSGQTKATISIDTSKPQVMQQAVEAGATFINDV
ncbi:MAG: dihydropteroate synthase, partial [Proteobacteria bacterium]|nr:dihydropteroate synthase [Pseudomonadota bacterium]